MEQRFGSMQLMAAKYNAHCMQIVKEDGAEDLEALKKKMFICPRKYS